MDARLEKRREGCCQGAVVVISFPLTTGEVARISDEDADLARLTWRRSTHGHLQRHVRHGKGLRTNQDLARTIMERFLVRPLTASDIVEHVDGDLLNNRRENLRLLGKSALRQRDPLRRVNTSGYTGDSYDRKRQQWKAYISLQGKRI